jgi:hypothetical protein
MQRTGDFVEGLADHVVEFALGRGDEGLDADEAGKLADGLAVDVGEAQLLVEVLDFWGALDPAADFDEIRNLERRIQRLDEEIDRLVYGLYGLTEAEIKIVKGG